MQALGEIRDLGYCVGLFDLNGDAADLLEQTEEVPQATAQRFLRHLAQAGPIIRDYIAQISALLGVTNPDAAELPGRAYDEGLREGRNASGFLSKPAVAAAYGRCSALKPLQPPMPQPQPPPQPKRTTASDIQAIPDKIRPCWQSFSRAAPPITVTLVVHMKPDGPPKAPTFKIFNAIKKTRSTVLPPVRRIRPS